MNFSALPATYQTRSSVTKMFEIWILDKGRLAMGLSVVHFPITPGSRTNAHFSNLITSISVFLVLFVFLVVYSLSSTSYGTLHIKHSKTIDDDRKWFCIWWALWSNAIISLMFRMLCAVNCKETVVLAWNIFHDHGTPVNKGCLSNYRSVGLVCVRQCMI